MSKVEFEPLTITADYPPVRTNIDPDQTKGWFRRLWPLLRSHRLVIAGAAISGVLGVALSVSVPLIIRRAFDQALEDQSSDLEPFVWALLAIGVALFALRATYRTLLFRAAHQVDTDLRELIYRRLARLSFSFYDVTASGEVISRANSDIRSVQILLAFAPLALLSILSFAIALVLMLRIHILLTVVALLPMPLVFGVAQHMRNQVFPLSWITSSRQAEVATVVDENIGGIRVVKSFAAEEQQISKLEIAATRLRWAAVEANDSRARHNPVVEALPQLGSAMVLLYGGLLVIDGRISIGTILAFNAYVILISLPFRLFGFLLMQSQRAAASARRIYAILDKEIEITDAADAIDLIDPAGAIEFDNVSFRYGSGADPDDAAGSGGEAPLILDNFNLRIQPGETVALVGRTGSGKSTVARLLPRFYDPAGGSIRIDGHDLRDLSMASIRHHVSVVLDEPFLFSVSVSDNIAYARPDASRADIVTAAKAAQAHDFIS
ncbi:MAG: ABC transporter ATP-binding protein, partial [Acidimicrobiales bacterium]